MLNLSLPTDRGSLEEFIVEVKRCYNYDFNSGNFIWKINRHGSKGIGSKAGTLDTCGYILIRVFRKNYLAHRVVWIIMTNDFPPIEIDHKDTNKANNKWENLREATKSQNRANLHKYKVKTDGLKSKFKGVTWHNASKKWQANIKINKVQKYLGVYELEIDAAKAYEKAAMEYYKEFARITPYA